MMSASIEKIFIWRENNMGFITTLFNITTMNHNIGSTVIMGENNIVENASQRISKGDWQEARNYVNEDNTLSDKQKEILKDILSEAENSGNSHEKRENSKNKFRNFVDCAGKTAEQIVKALSKIKSVADFFGISK